MKNRYRNRVELLQGTLDPLILQTLQWGPQHGYGISPAVRVNSGDLLRVETGSRDPALHRFERQKWLTSDWQYSDNNQPVKVYSLTAVGRKQLPAEGSRREQLMAAIAGVLDPASKGGR